MNNAFGTPILGRSVWVRHAHGDALLEKKGAGASIIKLATVVTLEVFNCKTELSSDIRKKVQLGLGRVGFEA
jgi:hypothetical protein